MSIVLQASPFAGRTVPDFGQMYHIKGSHKTFCPLSLQWLLRFGLIVTPFEGVISLPYAEIKEPFEGWYDLQGKRSRIDYYHGEFGFTILVFRTPLPLIVLT